METDIIFNQNQHEEMLPGAEEEAEFGKLPTHGCLMSLFSTYVYVYINSSHFL